ncbi:MAG: SLC13 family permease [Desulfobacterales bacterium]|nr:MAG: SLC13 family permease [Desulfobacterales bacterium]
MDKIQLLFFFISGFLISRLMIKVRLPQRLVYWFIGKRHLSLAGILFYLVAIAAFLSFFIPNAITVLTLLPLLELLRQSYEAANGPSKSVPTMLALATIYGANIGGMGSITATPANGILVTYAVLNEIPGLQYLTFASWLVWGVPLVVVFVCIAALILFIFMRPVKYNKHRIQLPFDSGQIQHRFQGITIWLTAFYFLSSLILSLLLMKFPDRILLILIVSGALTLVFISFLFFVPLRGSDRDHSRQKLLEIADCYNELPVKGFVFVAIAVVLAAILYAFDVHVLFSSWSARIIPTGLPTFALFFLVALAASFSTEVLSNTAVQLSFFVVALPLSKSLGFSALEALIIITLSSTCAFMSPIATGVNGLAFGGVKGVSFSRMLAVGFVMNLAGALLISSWVLYFIGRFYGL